MTTRTLDILKDNDHEALKHSTLRLPERQKKAIQQLSDRSGISFSEAARRVIEIGLNEGELQR